MASTMHGIDVSNYQAGLKIANTDAEFMIAKATEGTTYTDPYCDGFVNQAKSLGLPWGTYHFYAGGSGKAEADFYLDAVAGYLGEGLLVLDFERNTSNRSEPKAFLDRVLERTGIAPIIYLSGGVATAGGWDDVAKINGLWMARWGTSSPGDTGPWSSAILWQYTDSYATGGQHVDADYFYGDRSTWQAYAGDSGSSSQPASEDQPPTEGSIQTPYGQKGTAWASGYHQGDDWHRNAGADEVGDPIWAVASGKIIYAGDARSDGGGGWGSAFGIHVLNQWDDQGRTSIDAHMSKLHVKTGDRVAVGDLIGEKGATGNVSGPHDHHEQHTGTGWTDPDVKPIYPGTPTTGGGGSTSGKDDLEMSDHVEFHHRNPQKFSKADTYQWLRLDDDGDVSFVTYPSKIIGGVLYLEISGLGEADSVNVYAGSYDVKNTDDGSKYEAKTENHPDRITGVGSGWVHVSIPFAWQLGDQGSGWGYRALRWMIKTSTTKAKVENLRAEAWVVKN